MAAEPREPADRERQERQQALLQLLGLARRAGKLAVGRSAVGEMVRRGRRPLIVLARDAGGALVQWAERLEPVAGVVADAVDRQQLAQAMGRAEVAVVAVDDRGFLRGLAKLGGDREPKDDRRGGGRR